MNVKTKYVNKISYKSNKDIKLLFVSEPFTFKNEQGTLVKRQQTKVDLHCHFGVS